jgi:tripartite-type tricarboxylate transporter receptor subunit TctC
MRFAPRLSSAVLLTAALACRAAAVHAQPDADFQGKTVTIYVTNPPGGGYDLNARVLARHLGDHIPGHPAVVVSNMPGAHGITGANYVFNTAPKDGTALGAIVTYVPQYQVQGVSAVQYDAQRFGWVGSIAPSNETMYAWHSVPIQSLADLKNRETVLAADGAVETFARLLTRYAGARFKLVKGYRGTSEVHLAMERGEIEAAVSSFPVLHQLWPQWLAERKVRIFFYNGFTRDPAMPDVPASLELAETKADRDVLGFFAEGSALGRAFVAPADVPPATLAVLRAAFAATMKDGQFLADCRQSKLDVDPMSGEALQKLAARMVDVDAATRDLIREIAGNDL